MYQLLSFLSACPSVLLQLPVEMWCAVLRLLDRQSLLEATRSSAKFLDLARGDPALRSSLEVAIREEQERLMKRLTRPGLPAGVTRKEHDRMFSSEKVVKRERMERKKTSMGQRKTGQKAKTKVAETTRYKPYRL